MEQATATRQDLIDAATKLYYAAVRRAVESLDQELAAASRALQAAFARVDHLAGKAVLCACGCGTPIEPDRLALAARRAQRLIYVDPKHRFAAANARGRGAVRRAVEQLQPPKEPQDA